MNKTTKGWIITAFALVLAGGIVFGGVMTMLKWDFSKLSTTKFTTTSYNIGEDFKNISFETSVALIEFIPEERDDVSVICHNPAELSYLAEVKGDTLEIKQHDTRKWYDYIGINFGTEKITVSLPKGEYGVLSIKSSTGDIKIPEGLNFESVEIIESTGDINFASSASKDIKIRTSTGDVTLKNCSADSLDLLTSTGDISVSNVSVAEEIKTTVSTGDISMRDVTCGDYLSSGTTGDTKLKNVVCSGNMKIKITTGHARFDHCDAATLDIETDTGDISGSLLSPKTFEAESHTGDIILPPGSSGGSCKIKTDTGDIEISIE